MKEIIFNLSIEEYSKLLGIVQELNKVSDIHKIKWLQNEIIFYSLLTEKDNPKINAVKVFSISRSDLFTQLPANVELSFVISSGKEWLKKFKFLSEDNEPVEVTMRCKEGSNMVYTFAAKNSILELSSIGGEDRIIKDMPMTFIKNNMNPRVAEWSFTFSEEMYKKIKKISKLDTSELLTIKVSGNTIFLKDDSWELKVAAVDGDAADDKFFINKDFLDMVTTTENLTISMFQSYILLQEKESLLLYNLQLFA